MKKNLMVVAFVFFTLAWLASLFTKAIIPALISVGLMWAALALIEHFGEQK